jgi:hypothetical protein
MQRPFNIGDLFISFAWAPSLRIPHIENKNAFVNLQFRSAISYKLWTSCVLSDHAFFPFLDSIITSDLVTVDRSKVVYGALIRFPTFQAWCGKDGNLFEALVGVQPRGEGFLCRLRLPYFHHVWYWFVCGAQHSGFDWVPAPADRAAPGGRVCGLASAHQLINQCWLHPRFVLSSTRSIGYTIDYRYDNSRFWVSAHNCRVPSQNLELEQRIRIFGGV